MVACRKDTVQQSPNAKRRISFGTLLAVALTVSCDGTDDNGKMASAPDAAMDGRRSTDSGIRAAAAEVADASGVAKTTAVDVGTDASPELDRSDAANARRNRLDGGGVSHEAGSTAPQSDDDASVPSDASTKPDNASPTGALCPIAALDAGVGLAEEALFPACPDGSDAPELGEYLLALGLSLGDAGIAQGERDGGSGESPTPGDASTTRTGPGCYPACIDALQARCSTAGECVADFGQHDLVEWENGVTLLATYEEGFQVATRRVFKDGTECYSVTVDQRDRNRVTYEWRDHCGALVAIGTNEGSETGLLVRCAEAQSCEEVNVRGSTCAELADGTPGPNRCLVP